MTGSPAKGAGCRSAEKEDLKEMRRLCCAGFVLALSVLSSTPGSLIAETERGTETIEYRHRAELFFGVAHEEGGDEFAAGLAYEYRISRLLGVGGFVEHAGEEEDVWTFGVPLFVHPFKGARFLLAPGWETKEVESEEKETEQSFLTRAGIAYEYEVGRWSITPELNVDFIEGGHHVLVYGVSIGCGF